MWSKRAICLLLSFILVLTGLPLSFVRAYAAEAVEETESVLETDAGQDAVEDVREEAQSAEAAVSEDSDGASGNDVMDRVESDITEDADFSDAAAGQEDAVEAAAAGAGQGGLLEDDEQAAAAGDVQDGLQEDAGEADAVQQDYTQDVSQEDAAREAAAAAGDVQDGAQEDGGQKDAAEGTEPQQPFESDYAERSFSDDEELTFFADDDQTVFTDAGEAPSFVLNTDRLGDDWQDRLDLDVAVSAFEGGEDSRALEEGVEYALSDGGTRVTLSLSYVQARTEGADVWVHARVYVKGLDHNDENKVSESMACFRVRMTEGNYEDSLESDCEMLPDWDWSVRHWNNVYVRNTEFPDGADREFEVTGISSSDETVVETYVNDDPNDDSPFHYRAKKHGEAEIALTYLDLRGDEQIHTFTVYVKEDVYGVDIYTEDGSDRTLPGGTIALNAQAWRHSEVEGQEGVTDGLTCVWNLKKLEGHPEPALFASLTPSEDGRSASVAFSSIEGEEDGFWHEVEAEVFIYDGAYSEENPDENKVGYDHIRLTMADEYVELWPARIDSGLEAGDSVTVQAELRFYPGTNGNEYDLADSDETPVHYYWYYENWAVRVYDAKGNQVGNNDGEGNYQDSEESAGPSCAFTIYRRRQAGTEITLKACWQDENGQDHWEERRFRLDEKDYRAVLDDRGDSRVFSDGDKTVDVRVEGIPDDAQYGTDYQIEVLAVGLWEDDEDGDGREIKNPYPDSVWSLDPGGEDQGMTLTLHGGELQKQGLADDQEFGVQLLLTYNGERLWVEEGDFRFREAQADYHDREWDREMLPGWDDGHINNNYGVRVTDAEHPDGWETRYQVTDAAVKSQEPAQEGREVIALEKRYENDDPDSGEYWWEYRAVSHGAATITVTCQDVLNHQEVFSYDFNIYVKADVYHVTAQTQDGARFMRVLPGETVSLSIKEIWHASEDEALDGSTEGLVYVWKTADVTGKDYPGNPPAASFAALTQAQGQSAAAVTFRELNPGENDVWYDLDAEVYVYTSDDLENPVAFDTLRLTMASSYLYIEPAAIEDNLAVGQDDPVTARLFSYEASDGGGPRLLGDGEGNGSVHYFWYYDPNAVQILDEDDIQVGNEDGEGNYNDSEKSAGAARSFTIRRLKNWDTDISLAACWTDENGREYWGEQRDYHLSRTDYNIWFDEHDVNVYTDTYSSPGGPRTLSLNVGNLASLGDDWAQKISLDLCAGRWNDRLDQWDEELTEGADYTMEQDGDRLRFTLTQAFLAAMDEAYQAQTGPDYDNIRITARIYPKNLPDEEKTEENRLTDTDAWFHVHVAKKDYDREEDRVMLPGWDGTVSGSRSCRVEDTGHEDGEDIPYKVKDVKVVRDDPWEGEHGKVVADFHRDHDENNNDDYWWYYRVKARGEADLEVTYEDLDGSEQSYVFTLYVGDDAYSVYMDSTGRERNAFPGASIELYADANHEFFDEEGEQQSDANGLGYAWDFEYGGEYAEIEVHEDDPSRATLRFKPLPEGEDRIDEEVKVGVRILNAQGDETEGYDSTRFWVRSEYNEIWPLLLDRNLDVGQSIQDQKFEVRSYVMGRNNYEVIDPSAVRYEWHYDENVMSVTEEREEDGMPVPVEVQDGESALTDTFSIRRKGDWNSDYSVRAFWQNENGDQEDCWGNYQLWRRDYGIWFRNHDETIYTDACVYQDGHPEFEIPALVLDLGNLGENPEGTFDVVVTAGKWENDDWGDLLGLGEDGQAADYVVTPGEGVWKVSLTREYLENLAGQGEGADIHVTAEVYPKGAERNEKSRLGDNDAWFHVRLAREEYNREENRTMLPGWDGTVSGFYDVYLENSEHPDGQNARYRVKNVEVVRDEPRDEEEESIFSDFHRDQDENNENDYWWYYRVERCGEAVLKVTYEDLAGEEKSYEFTLYVGDDVYSVYMDSEGRERNALPGDSIELYADADHEYYGENGEYHNDDEGLGYDWFFEYGGEYAEIIVHEDDPSRATLRFNPLPEGKDWIDEDVRVGVRILNAKGEETEGYDSTGFWVRSEYTEIWPLMLDRNMEVGQSIEDVQFEVRRYVLGRDGYEVIDDGRKVSYQWYYDQNLLAITEKQGGEPVLIPDGEAGAGNTFTLTRRREWRSDFNVRAFWTNENGDEEDVWGNYQLWDRNYETGFVTDGHPVGDDETIRDDEEKTYTLDIGSGFGGDIVYIVDYRAADNKESAGTLLDGLQEGPDYYVNEGEGGSIYVNLREGEEYTIDHENNTLTIDGDLVERTLRKSRCADSQYKNEFYIGALLSYEGNSLGNCWRRILLDRTGKSIQAIEASDVTLTMFDHPAVTVKNAKGALSFESSDEAVVKVDKDGKLVPVAEGSAKIAVKAAATEDYRHGRTAFSVTVTKLSLSDKKVSMTLKLPSGGYTYDGKAKKPAATLTYNGTALVKGTDYDLSYSANTNAGTATVTAKGKGRCTGTVKKTFKIAKAAQKITGPSASYKKTYGDKAFTLNAKATGKLTYSSSARSVVTVDAKGKVTIKGAGSAKITITAAAATNYLEAKKTVTVTVAKAAPVISVKTASKTYTVSALKKAAQTFSPGATVNSKGKLSYKKSSGSAQITVNATTGKITVKKGTKKGTYKAKITVSAAAKGNYNKGTKTFEVKITVK